MKDREERQIARLSADECVGVLRQRNKIKRNTERQTERVRARVKVPITPSILFPSN